MLHSVSKTGQRGDATLDRIANLADGWAAPVRAPSTAEPVDTSEVRSKPRTVPPPAPGSSTRQTQSPPQPVAAQSAEPMLPVLVHSPTQPADLAAPVATAPVATAPVAVSVTPTSVAAAPVATASAAASSVLATPSATAASAAPGATPGSRAKAPSLPPPIPPRAKAGSMPPPIPGKSSPGSGPNLATREGRSTGAVPTSTPRNGRTTGSVPMMAPLAGRDTGGVPAAARDARATGGVPIMAPREGRVTGGVPLQGSGSVRVSVPVGEFGNAPATIAVEPEVVALGPAAELAALVERNAQRAPVAPPANTVKREAPLELLLNIPDSALRGDSTQVDTSTTPFDRADPTGTDELRGDATMVNATGSSAALGGSLRVAPQLPQRRGLGGDVRYVFTALFGASRARRELSTIESEQTERQKSRRDRLITIGKSAIISERFDHPAVANARESFAEIEEKRSGYAGQVAATDAELLHVARNRESKAKQTLLDIAELERSLTEIASKLAPIEKDHGVIRKRANELREQLARIDSKIAATEASIVSVKTPRQDRAAVGAELATMKADRAAVQRDEPTIAAQLDELAPRLAKLEAERSAALASITEKKAAELADSKRSTELIDAIKAKRKVVERATADAETQRDALLVELGEKLYVDRPRAMTANLDAIDELDVAYGTTDRRGMDVREILSSIDKWKVFRGVVVIVIAVLAIVAAVVWFVAVMPAR